MQISDKLYNAIYRSPLLIGVPTTHSVHKMQNLFKRSRDWYYDVYMKWDLHNAIDDLFSNRDLRDYITDWREMVLEHPHVSTEEPTKLAYTRNDDHGNRDVQTRTTLGKYLKRHMPTCPDHLLRDFVAKYTIDLTAMHITFDMEQMLWVLQNGPESCMKREWDTHPYRTYDPMYGWGMAYRMEGDTVVSRGLVNKREMGFVRTYKRCSDGGSSQPDLALEAWLKTQEYSHMNDWEGCKLAAIVSNDRYVAPYLDGSVKNVDVSSDHMVICDDGDYEADNTDGYLSENGEICDCCDGRFHEDELIMVGEDGDERVCESCINHNYTWVIGYRECQYYLLDSDCNIVFVASQDQYYDARYLSDNDIVYCEDDCDYYHLDDVWFCEGSGEYYTDETPSYEIEGCLYHEDHLPDGWELNEDNEPVQVEAEVKQAA